MNKLTPLLNARVLCLRLTTLLVLVLMTGCSLFSQPDDTEKTLENINALKVRLLSNDPLETSHDDVIARYQRYLDVATEPEMRIRVAHRIASLKLQSEEIALDNMPEESDAALNVGVRQGEARWPCL